MQIAIAETGHAGLILAVLFSWHNDYIESRLR